MAEEQSGQFSLELPVAFRHLDTPARHKAIHGGRGGAKSHSVAQKLLDRGKERKLRILCAREIQKSITTSVKQLLDDKILRSGYSDFYDSTERKIVGANGTEFLFAGLRSNPDSVKSMEGVDIAWVEEANTVSKASMQLLIPTIRKPGSELWWTWNRRFAKDPVDALFLGPKGPPPRSLVWQVNYYDNPWFPPDLREEMEWDRLRDHEKYMHVWMGEPVVHSESKVFKHWEIGDLDDRVPKGTVPRFGADWGFGDPTVLVKCYVWGRTLYFSHEAYKVNCRIQDIPKLFAGVPEADRYAIRGDSSRPDTILYMRENGYPQMRHSTKGPDSVRDGIEFMKGYDIVVHPRCTHIAAEMATYSYKTDRLTGEILPELEDKNNHTIDSARYALEGERKGRDQDMSGLGGEVITEGAYAAMEDVGLADSSDASDPLDEGVGPYGF